MPPLKALPGRNCFCLTAFPLEWAILLGFLALTVPLLCYAGLSFSITAGSVLYMSICLLIALTCRILASQRWRLEKWAMGAEFMALCLVSSTLFALATYWGASLSAPLTDTQLIRIDQALGFDWPTYFQHVRAYPSLIPILDFCYDSFLWQWIIFIGLFAALGYKKRLQELFWLLFLSGVLTTLVFTLFPSLGPFSIYGIAHQPAIQLFGAANYLDDLLALRAKTALHFNLATIHGIVNFPSYHTILALLYCYCFRGSGLLHRALLLTNLGMLIAIPAVGGHYLCDMLAGAVITAASILMVRKILWAGATQDPENTGPIPVLSLLAF